MIVAQIVVMVAIVAPLAWFGFRGNRGREG
jgi:hypothetical protein